MKRAVIYGATGTGKDVYRKVCSSYQIIHFVDGDPKLHGQFVCGIEVKNPEELTVDGVDVIFLGVLTGQETVMNELYLKGFSEEQIITKYVDLASRARRDCIEKIVRIFADKKVGGQIAELGVYRGDFAKEMNEVFCDRKLYLFDTFEGFPEQDMQYEEENDLMMDKVGKLSNTSVDFVLGRMPHPENCIVRKGYFPDTAEGLEEEFCFVNIDTDLYKPILENGYIFVHDYFSLSYGGAKKAIEEFAEKYHVGFIPIGDTLSVAFVKK